MSDAQILEGDLQSFALPRVLKTLAVRKATGILTVQGEDDIVAVSCLNGHIVTADSLNQTQEDSLGELLIRQSLVAKSDFDAVVLEHQGSGGTVGELLVSRGLITPEKLLECLRLQTYRLMLQILVWRGGEFKFYGGDEVSYEKGMTPISVEEMLMRALSDLGEKSGVGGKLPKLDAVYRPIPPRGDLQILGRDGTGDLDGGSSGIWITDVQHAFLERMNGRTSAFDIARSLGTGRFRTLFSLHQLIQSDLIEVHHAQADQQSDTKPVARPEPGTLQPGTLQPGTLQPGTLQPGTLQSSTPQPESVPHDSGPALDTMVLRPTASPVSSGVPVPGPEASRAVERPSTDDFDDDLTIASVPINPRPWIGAALALFLVGALGLVFIERPTAYLLPFPWQQDQRAALERQMRQTLFYKIDAAVGTYHMMEFQYPRNLKDLVGRGLLGASDLRDPAGHALTYSFGEESYKIEIVDGDSVESRTNSIQGDISRDLDLFPPEIMKNPLVLLD